MSKQPNKELIDSNNLLSLKKYRENGRDVIEFMGYKYCYSNPITLKQKKGKNWKCVLSTCRGTMKTFESQKGVEDAVEAVKHCHKRKSLDSTQKMTLY